MTVTKSELAARLAINCGDISTKASATRIVDAVLETIAESLENGVEVSLAGFGKWKTKERAARTGRNPQTGDPVQIPARTVVAFKPATALKVRVDASK